MSLNRDYVDFTIPREDEEASRKYNDPLERIDNRNKITSIVVEQKYKKRVYCSLHLNKTLMKYDEVNNEFVCPSCGDRINPDLGDPELHDDLEFKMINSPDNMRRSKGFSAAKMFDDRSEERELQTIDSVRESDNQNKDKTDPEYELEDRTEYKSFKQALDNL